VLSLGNPTVAQARRHGGMTQTNQPPTNPARFNRFLTLLQH
jgi:hypothetical protein